MTADSPKPAKLTRKSPRKALAPSAPLQEPDPQPEPAANDFRATWERSARLFAAEVAAEVHAVRSSLTATKVSEIYHRCSLALQTAIVRSLGDRDFAYEVYLGFHEAYLNELSFLGTRDSNQRKRALN